MMPLVVVVLLVNGGPCDGPLWWRCRFAYESFLVNYARSVTRDVLSQYAVYDLWQHVSGGHDWVAVGEEGRPWRPHQMRLLHAPAPALSR